MEFTGNKDKSNIKQNNKYLKKALIYFIPV
jgi:hypothetical protein